MKVRKFRPMYAMSLDWHLTRALEENEFSEVSDKLRDQLTERGMPPREAAIKAPVMLDGMDKALQGEFDFKRIRNELCVERGSRDAASPLTLAAG
ncbi:MAG: hypothetical protein WBK19_13055 [Azonexus sp.]